MGVNATLVDSGEEPLVRFTATQQDAPVLRAESQGAVVVDDDLGSSELDVPVGQPSLQGDHLQNIFEEQQIRSFGFR